MYIIKRNLQQFGVTLEWNGERVQVRFLDVLLEEHDAYDLRTAAALMAEVETAYHSTCCAMA